MNKIEFEKVIEKHLPDFENRTAKNWDAEMLMRDFASDLLSIPVEKRVSPMLAKGNKVDCNNCYECLKDKTDEHGLPIPLTRMILCPICGNKRCPKATDHNLECTNSNESGQAGSRY